MGPKKFPATFPSLCRKMISEPDKFAVCVTEAMPAFYAKTD